MLCTPFREFRQLGDVSQAAEKPEEMKRCSAKVAELTVTNRGIIVETEQFHQKVMGSSVSGRWRSLPSHWQPIGWIVGTLRLSVGVRRRIGGPAGGDVRAHLLLRMMIIKELSVK